MKINERVFAFGLACLPSEPHRGDIAVFPFPDDESILYLKRIIGLPGEKIDRRKNGLIMINDVPLQGSDTKEPIHQDFGPYQIPDPSYFMLENNRNASDDSRFWDHTCLSRDQILGKAIFPIFLS